MELAGLEPATHTSLIARTDGPPGSDTRTRACTCKQQISVRGISEPS
jgi:hypothetical protein